MKSKLAVACAALLAIAAGPAFAVQLGQIEIRSALNQPLVAAIPVHPDNLAELDGMSVGLASPEDFARAGLTETATDRTLRFHLTTDNNGQKLILVTSSEPVSDPYLDFLVQVNTRQGKEVREFVVLLNPVIASPAPEVQSAPMGGAAVPELPAPPPASIAPVSTPAPAPVAVAPPRPQPEPVTRPQPAAQPPSQAVTPAPAAPTVARKALRPAPEPQSAVSAEVQPGAEVTVKRGDTLSGIASGIAPGSGANLDQVMLALQTANPQAFYGKNINNLKAGAILRVPAGDALTAQTIAAAAAAVRQQHESWQAVKAHRATVLEGAAEEAAAKTAPVVSPPAPAADHLTLAPASGNGAGTASRPGAAGGTGTGAAAGIGPSLQGRRDTLLSLDQANTELQERVQRLEALSEKTGKLLSLKDSTIAELQHKLATMQTAAVAAAGPHAARTPVSGPAVRAGVQVVPVPWYLRPLAWVIGALVVLALIVLGLLGRRDRAPAVEPAHGPLPELDDLPSAPADPGADPSAEPEPDATEALQVLADADRASEPPGALESAGEAVDEPFGDLPAVPEAPVRDPVATDGAAGAGQGGEALVAIADDPARLDAAHDDEVREATLDVPPSVVEPAPVEPIPVAAPVPPSQVPAATAEGYGDDPVDIKLDLARAYLDMGDHPGARAMLDEVLAQGSRVQQDEARRLLAEATE